MLKEIDYNKLINNFASFKAQKKNFNKNINFCSKNYETKKGFILKYALGF